MRFLLVACVLVILILICIPTAEATYPGNYYDTQWPLEHWAYPACDMLAERGCLKSFDVNYFNGSESREYIDFLTATIELFEYLDTNESKTSFDRDQWALRRIAEVMFTEFGDKLVIAKLKLGVGSYYFENPQQLQHVDRTEEYVRGLLGRELGGGSARLTAYDDVPKDHWAYAKLAAFRELGYLERYPVDFFSSDRVLTRYEFAQAIDMLADSIDLHGAQPGLIEQEVFDLILEFRDTMPELAGSLR